VQLIVAGFPQGEDRSMRFADIRFSRIAGLLLVCLIFSGLSHAQEKETNRKVITKVAPVYPELARKMNIAGTVKLQVLIGADGSVKTVKPLGGHPLLIDSAVAAMKAWKYEHGAEETTVVEFKFAPAS
jgi:TonB family protein